MAAGSSNPPEQSRLSPASVTAPEAISPGTDAGHVDWCLPRPQPTRLNHVWSIYKIKRRIWNEKGVICALVFPPGFSFK